jgi:hypothetical protein
MVLAYFGTCGKAEHHGTEGTAQQKCSPHGGWEGKRVAGRGPSQHHLQGHAPSDLTSFTRLHLLKVLLPLNSARR